MGAAETAFIVRLKRLDWTAPRLPPHGLAGAACLLSGAFLIACALSGYFPSVYWPSLCFYISSALANAIGGYRIAGRAPKSYQQLFRIASVFQACLIFYCWRFSPLCSDYGLGGMIDWVFAVGIVLGILSLLAFACVRLPFVIVVAVFIGCLALLLLAVYPMQLALGGIAWWQCLQTAYPLQRLGMVAYIYVPATWAFAAMMFGATLWLRKVISTELLVVGFVGMVMASLLCTVMMQEVHMPVVSTQRLYLPCPSPLAGSWEAELVDVVDVSRLAQSILQVIRDRTGWRLAPV